MAVAPTDETSAESGSVETLEQLFAALESPLLSYALRLVRERELAEDVVQEAFMKLHASFGEVEQPRRWLYRTVHNLALNHLRRQDKIVSLDDVSGAGGGPGNEWPDPKPLPDELIARWEGIGLVRLKLATLDARSRELIRLKFHEGLSYQQMSERMGLSVSNVGYLLHHAIKSIAAELEKTGGMP
jgi:RNA polymerase sigma-70 factor (ECF subfamily)